MVIDVLLSENETLQIEARYSYRVGWRVDLIRPKNLIKAGVPPFVNFEPTLEDAINVLIREYIESLPG
jgi:hypothetical protein